MALEQFNNQQEIESLKALGDRIAQSYKQQQGVTGEEDESSLRLLGDQLAKSYHGEQYQKIETERVGLRPMGGGLAAEIPPLEKVPPISEAERQQWQRGEAEYPKTAEEMSLQERAWLQAGELVTTEEFQDQARRESMQKFKVTGLPADMTAAGLKGAAGLYKMAGFFAGKITDVLQKVFPSVPREKLQKISYDDIASNLDRYAAKFDKEGLSPGVWKDMAQGTTEAILIAIPSIRALGGYGLAVHGGITGLAETGKPIGAALGALQGALTHNILGAIGLAPSAARVPLAYGFGYATTPGGVRERAGGAATWAGLEFLGGHKPTTAREFVENYPRLKKFLSERDAMKFVKTYVADVSKKNLRRIKDEFGSVKGFVDAEMERARQSIKQVATPTAMPERIPVREEMLEIRVGRDPATGEAVIKIPKGKEFPEAVPPSPFVMKEVSGIGKVQFPKDVVAYWPEVVPRLWKEIYDVTGGRMVGPIKGEEAEWQALPKQLRRKEGMPLDEVADGLKMESEALRAELIGARRIPSEKELREMETERVEEEFEEYKETAAEAERIEREIPGERAMRLRKRLAEIEEVERPKAKEKPPAEPEWFSDVKDKLPDWFKEWRLDPEKYGKMYERVVETFKPKGGDLKEELKAYVMGSREYISRETGEPKPKITEEPLPEVETKEEARITREVTREEVPFYGETKTEVEKTRQEDAVKAIREKATEEKFLKKVNLSKPEVDIIIDGIMEGRGVREDAEAMKKKGLPRANRTFAAKARKDLLNKLSKIDLPYDAWKSEAEGGFIRFATMEGFGSKGSKLYTDLIDRFHPIKKLSDIVRKSGDELPGFGDPYILVRNLLGVAGKAELKLTDKRFRIDERGNRITTGKSLKDILKPVKKEIEEFDRYLAYRRVPELIKRGIETGIDEGEARLFIKEYEKRFEPIAKEFTEFHDSLLKELTDVGLLSKDKYNAIKANNQMYAPFQRVIEELDKYGYVASSRNLLTKIRAPIHKIKGSERPVISPLESTVKATYAITSAVERARVANMIIGLRKLSPEVAQLIKPVRPKMAAVATLEDGTKIFRPSVFQDKGIVQVWEKGERKFYEVPRDVYDAMSQLSESTLGPFTKMLAIPARILRAGATSTLEFAFRNPLRDQHFAFINTRGLGYVPIIDFTKGLFALVGKTETYKKWKAGGGEWSMLVTLDRATNQKRLKQVMGKKDFAQYLKNPIKILEDISMLGEMPTRIGVFSRAKKKGASDIWAAYQSREGSIDFARRGALTKNVMAIYTFFNARTQALDKLRRTAMERPFEFMLKVLPVSVLPSVINYMVNRDDPEYWAIPEWQRDMFWIWKIKGTYVRFPKGDVGVIFGTTTEKVLEFLDKDKTTKPSVVKLAGSIIKEMMPISDIGGFLPTAFRPVMEIVANKKFYVMRPIIPRGKEKLTKTLQYGPYTSEAAKALGKKAGVSPYQIEHAVTGYTAGLGRYGLKLSDWVFGEMGAIPKKEARPKELADYPLLSAFIVRGPLGFGSETVNTFYEISDDLQSFKTTDNKYKSTGDDVKLKKWRKEHALEVEAIRRGLYTKFNRTRSKLSELRKKSEKILDHKDFSVEEKQTRLDAIDKDVMRLVTAIMAQYRALEHFLGEKQ